MAYCIHYNSICFKTPIREKKRVIFPRAATALVLVFAILAGVVLCSGNSLCKYLLPGDPKVTEEALCGFTEDIRNGIPLADAAEVFCRKILDNAVLMYE